MGVSPRGAQVLRSTGIRRNPDSSTKTRWAPSRAAFFYTRPFAVPPTRDRIFVALECTPLGLLVAPSQLMEQAADVVGVIPVAKLPADQLGDSLAGPQLGRVALHHGTVLKQFDQSLQLRVRELRRPARRRTDLEHRSSLGVAFVAPTHHGARLTPDTPRYLIEGVSLIQKRECATATVGQHLRGSLGSHGSLPPATRVLHYLRVN